MEVDLNVLSMILLRVRLGGLAGMSMMALSSAATSPCG